MNWNRFDKAFDNLRKVFDWLVTLVSIGIVLYAIYQSTQVQTTSERNALIFGGILGGTVVFLTSKAIDFGFHVQGKMFDWVEAQFTKYTSVRRWILAPIAALSATFAPILILVYGQFNVFWTVFLFVVFGFIFPAAITSIVREQRKRENTFSLPYTFNEKKG